MRHTIDVERALLERVVSDATGELEREVVDLDHLCVTCALREDVLPTVLRLAGEGRWDSVLLQLPSSALADPLCDALARDAVLRRTLRVHAVLAATDGRTTADDLLGDDLLRERGWGTSPGDHRGVGEALAALVEAADVVLAPDAAPVGRRLLRTLAAPGAVVLGSAADLDVAAVVRAPHHDHRARFDWTRADRRVPLPVLPPQPDAVQERVWRLDLSSDRPFHPARLLADLGRLGSGRHRSRGCFWLPTRTDDVLAWDGAGGQLSIGTVRPWGPIRPFTRIVVTGVGERPAHLVDAFEHLLVTAEELELRGPAWETVEDGLEPWLGPLRRAA
ncbi:GTP-binding protein [Nocardioides bruguierae]|uniref:GTP-binding protein n=1 Tax=Nocardioides bruguierae TaxID=2945102 RepID=A0A9X2D8D3_9ACTN|nr:GTP-binding protein [Nocardioides bruguierae]MCM0621183.1 GTP-binding protein [Nocardioides bruguierae]